MPAILSVNLNAVALLRNRRDLPWPSVEQLGRIALAAGAGGLTVHPRPDQRHIRFTDLAVIRNLIDDAFPEAEFNIEGYPSDDFLSLAMDHAPEQVTLVPDDPAQATSDHGFDVTAKRSLLEPAISRLKKGGYRVAVFMDQDAPRQSLEELKAMGADRIELYTGPYGGHYNDPSGAAACLDLLGKTAADAQEIGLGVNAGHDLTVENLPALAKAIPFLAETSIGHGLTADALEFGMAETVKRFLRALGHEI